MRLEPPADRPGRDSSFRPIPPGVAVPYAGRVSATPSGPLWAEPAAAPTAARAGVAGLGAVGGAGAAALLEGTAPRGRDLAAGGDRGRAWCLALAVAVAAHPPAARWSRSPSARPVVRRHRRRCRRPTGRRSGSPSSVYVLLLPYALFRWGSGARPCSGLRSSCVAYVARRSPATGPASATRSAACRVPAASRRRSARPCATGGARRRRARAGQAAASASSSPATCTTRSPTTSRRSRSGPRPAAPSPHRPDAAARRCEVIEAEASRTLAEMRAMVGVLRDGDEPPTSRPAGRRRHRAARRRRRRRRRASRWSCPGDLDGLPPSVGRRGLPPRPGVDHQRPAARAARDPHRRPRRRRRTTACG